VVDFYEFYEGLQEGWDGPALLVFSDGKRVGARLDRNGLRPARFWRTADDTIYVASEVRQLFEKRYIRLTECYSYWWRTVQTFVHQRYGSCTQV
jgi:hypothetical protein